MQTNVTAMMTMQRFTAFNATTNYDGQTQHTALNAENYS